MIPLCSPPPGIPVFGELLDFKALRKTLQKWEAFQNQLGLCAQDPQAAGPWELGLFAILWVQVLVTEEDVCPLAASHLLVSSVWSLRGVSCSVQPPRDGVVLRTLYSWGN